MERPKRPKRLRALVIEDEPLIQQMVGSLLRRAYDNPEFVVVNNADKAIMELKRSIFDGYFNLIISDFNLVGSKTGADVLAWIKEQDEEDASRWLDSFLFFSATTDVDLEVLHPNVLRKPVSLAVLRERLLSMTVPKGIV